MRKLLKLYFENRRIVILTFELFWIVIFLLEAASASSGPGIGGFVYVNF